MPEDPKDVPSGSIHIGGAVLIQDPPKAEPPPADVENAVHVGELVSGVLNAADKVAYGAGVAEATVGLGVELAIGAVAASVFGDDPARYERNHGEACYPDKSMFPDPSMSFKNTADSGNDVPSSTGTGVNLSQDHSPGGVVSSNHSDLSSSSTGAGVNLSQVQSCAHELNMSIQSGHESSSHPDASTGAHITPAHPETGVAATAHHETSAGTTDIGAITHHVTQP